MKLSNKFKLKNIFVYIQIALILRYLKLNRKFEILWNRNC